jgi:PadR family transcriptional regulator PadR
MEPGDARNVLTQLRRGTIEYCVLAVLADSEEYAFELVRRLSAVDGLVTSEGTIYPLLSRLRRDAMVTTTWQESDSGPPRKYYRLTPAGRRALSGFTEEWTRFRDAVDELLVGGRGPSKGDQGDRREQ